MARETKAQRLARELDEREAYFAEQEASYPARLMNTLRRSSSAWFDLTVVDNKFRVSSLNKRDRDVWELDYQYNQESQDFLEDLERAVSMKEAELAEAERVNLVRANARAKLTEEERELLNL